MSDQPIDDGLPTDDELEAAAAATNGHYDVWGRDIGQRVVKPAVPPLRVLNTRELLQTEPPPLDWLAEGVFCRGKLTLFGGREKRGKSLLQLAMAVAMASGGGTVGGIDVVPSRTLLVDAENGEREIHRRLRAMGLEPVNAEELVIAEARGFELREHLEHISVLAEEHNVDLVLLDSFRSLWRGDERDEAEVAAALDPLRDLAHDTNVAYGLTHHAQKGGDEYRGSSAIGASIDWCVMIDRHPEDDDKTRRRLTNPLARFAPERGDRWLSIRSGGDDGPVTVDPAGAFAHEREAPARGAVEAEIREHIRFRHFATLSTGDGEVAKLSWTTSELIREAGHDPKDGTAYRAVQKLAERGEIYREDKRWHPSPALFDAEDDG